MTENLNYKTDDSWCYDDKISNCQKYGRLYTWDAAINACPSGWRLPTDDDWWNMASYYGKAYNFEYGQSINKDSLSGKEAYKALIEEGSSSFSVVMGGYRDKDGSFKKLDMNGYYWSNSEQSFSIGWYYAFSRLVGDLGRYNYDKSVGRSCRCIQD